MAVSETEFVRADSDHLCFRKACNLVEIAFYNVHVAGGRAHSSKELEGLLTAQVASAQNELDLSRSQKLFDLRVQVPNAVGDVEIADDERKDHDCECRKFHTMKQLRFRTESSRTLEIRERLLKIKKGRLRLLPQLYNHATGASMSNGRGIITIMGWRRRGGAIGCGGRAETRQGLCDSVKESRVCVRGVCVCVMVCRQRHARRRN